MALEAHLLGLFIGNSLALCGVLDVCNRGGGSNSENDNIA